jgi:CheY-like chemotaxis protein/DNA-binding XRE family transcriptional regulator
MMSVTPPNPPDPSRPSMPPPLSVVALDDDADFREYIAGLLEADGHEARTASTADEFFDSGERVLEEIRRRWPRLCVIVVTGYPSLDSMRSTLRPAGSGGAVGRGVFDYLSKPFSTAELRRSLSEAAAAFGLGLRPQDKLRQELGKQIRLARTGRGWTLKDLSESSGISVSQLSSIERGSHLPSLESLLSIGGALEVKASAWLSAAGF